MILARHLGRELARGWLVFFAILSALFALLQLVEELDNLSERYRFVHALWYIGLTTPQRILELSPVIAALGTLTAFANLSRHSELVVMRAAGLSMRRLLLMALWPALALVAALLVSSEYLVASLHHRAETQRSVLRSGNLDLLAGKGLWSRTGEQVLNVRRLQAGRAPSGISLYEFDTGHRLLRAIEAERAELESDRRWRLVNVRIKDWSEDGLKTETRASLDLGPFWSAAELPALGQSTAAMSPGALYRYAEYLRATGQDDATVRMAFWQKATLPASAAAMVFLCAVIGIGFGSTRSAAFGLRVLTGAAIGVGFYLLTQIFHTGGQLLGLPQALVVLLPILLVVLAGILLARHTRGPR